MKCKPILFSAPMVQAILDGRKTMTRRVMNPQPVLMNGHIWNWQTAVWPVSNIRIPILNQDDPLYLLSRYKPVDILWVRETWCEVPYESKCVKQPDGGILCFAEYAYKATSDVDYSGIWRPSIFMPKEACRIWLRVMDIRVERVQEISTADAVAEGALEYSGNVGKITHNTDGTIPRTQFHLIWDSINDARSFGWDSNPWVWVITFERVERPEGWPEVVEG